MALRILERIEVHSMMRISDKAWERFERAAVIVAGVAAVIVIGICVWLNYTIGV